MDDTRNGTEAEAGNTEEEDFEAFDVNDLLNVCAYASMSISKYTNLFSCS